MKCFHFSNGGDKRVDSDHEGSVVSWARSLSVASDTTRRSEFECGDSYDFLLHRRSNDLTVFSFAELKAATRGFSRALLVGEGGFGCVYRGLLGESVDVAVKQLNRSGFQGHKEWINEVNFLGVVKHPNLVKLVGYCAEDDERGIQRLLVYEFMPNKSLEDHLLARMPSPLSWLTRLTIARDAARGLAYLHEQMDFQLIFRDFKTSNILLDDHFNAKLSDFGLARQGPTQGATHVSTAVVGTVGYAAPEYVQTGKLTAKSDVWSFGVVLFELITGRRAVERNLPRTEQKLLDWVKPYISDSKKFHIILDPRLEGQYCIKSAQKLASLANRCLLRQPKSRPKMSEVVEILGTIIANTLPQQVSDPPQVSDQAVEVEDDSVVETIPVSTKHGTNYLKRVFDIREAINLRNKSIGKLYWRNWTPGLDRTS